MSSPPSLILWREVSGELRPLASRCRECARMGFPRSQRCRQCGSKHVEDTALDPRGVIEAISLMQDLPVVHVRTFDGVLLLGRGVAGDSLRIGRKVRFVVVDGHMGFKADE